MSRRLPALALLLVSLPAGAAEETLKEAQQAQLESARAQVASQLQLQACDLLDELVYGWREQPLFAAPTPVVLAGVSVPVGFGSGLQALLENHFAALVLANAQGHLTLAHCPQCSALVVHSGAKGTVLSRGVDAPETMAAAGALAGSRHALFLDFEAEGSSLVLRARITSLEAALPIVYARTLSTSTSTPSLLRSPDHLKSAAEARQEYLDTLTRRSAFTVPVRIGVRTYAAGPDSPVGSAPFLWVQAGVEGALSQARAWTASFSVGGSWMPQLHTGFLFQGRVARLLSGPVASLTRPDLYAFVGASVISITGKSALAFQNRVPDVQNAIALALGNEPSAVFGAFQLGLELRVKNRIGVGLFVEALPGLKDAPAIGEYLNLGLFKLQSLGVEVAFCF